MKIKSYKVVSAGSLDYIETEVSNAIDDGWQPFGGICSVPVKSLLKNEVLITEECGFYQAMIKE